jgi:MFS transporter, OFA family, oxalate/formate antiporter
MNGGAQILSERRTWPASLPFYYGWINVLVASVAMAATLPGRTHGLGLIAEPLLADLQLDRVLFARINLVASLIGAAFCIPAGWLIDRYGVRSVLVGVTLALAASVVGMSECSSVASLAATLVLVRGLGQSALSVASMAAIGKWFNARLGIAMGVFAVLLTFGFIAGVLGMGEAIRIWGWRTAWQSLGLSIAALVPFFWILTRSTPESCGVAPDAPEVDKSTVVAAVRDYTLREALATPAFWAVAAGSSVFNLVWSGVTLFNESLLAEYRVNQQSAVEVLAILTGVGLVANLAAGALTTRERVVRLLGFGLLLLAGGLIAIPTIGGVRGARIYAIAMGLSGGIVTVVFFAAWTHLFGSRALGRIQGAAQLATVFASAAGPLVLTEGRALSGSYTPVMLGLAAGSGLLALVAFVVPTPD